MELQARLAFAQGRIEAQEGRPQQWPEDIPEDDRPERFRLHVEEMLEELPDARLSRLDCSEFPCIAVLETESTLLESIHSLLDGDPRNDEERERLHDALGRMADRVYGDDAFQQSGTWTALPPNGGKRRPFFDSALWPCARTSSAPEVKERIRHRIDALWKERAEELGIEAPY